MARIPEDELARLKAQVSLAALVEAAGIELKIHGENLVGRCPWHEDHGPSLVVTPAKNLWHCMGACQVGGSVIDWVMKARGVRFRHAVEILRAGNPALVAGPPATGSRHWKRPLPSAVELAADDQKLLNQVIDYYHQSLKSSTEALAYLERRGIRHTEAIETFHLGFANRTLCYRLPSATRKVGQDLRERLERIGILRASGHEHLAGSLVIPILDEHGSADGLYGRKITPNLRGGTPLHLYLHGPHKGVWNVAALAASKEIILCEALIDALTFWCAGFRNVTSSYGVCGFTDEILEAFKRHGVQKVLVAYDRDDAGDAAVEKLAPQLSAAGLEVGRILFPRGMDANEYALKVTPASESLGILIRSAQFVSKGKAASASAKKETVQPLAADLSIQAQGAKVEPPVDPAEAPPAAMKLEPDTVELVLQDRTYRARGLEKNLSHGALRVTLRVSRGEKYHVDTLDLYSARQRGFFIKQAADELGVGTEAIKKDLGRVLLELEGVQEKRIRAAMEPKSRHVVIPEDQKAQALELLKDPRLLDRIVEDFERVGIIGEATNKLVGYLAAVSRKLDEPLAILIQSSSAAGKSALMDAILSLVPDEDVERYTAMTGQALFYMIDTKLSHKVLAIAEVEGAERAGYAIKMLQSEGKISIATTIKDPQTGLMVTKKNEVEGPVALVLTTTDVAIDEELQNRALVLTVDEERCQTRAIHQVQRRAHTLEGLLARQDRAGVISLHQNAQRLLRPLLVVNPYADRLTFADTKLRTRRDHVKYLTLIRAVALLHQYQRPVRHVQHRGRVVPYIEATLSDVTTANRLAAEVLGRSLDELAPQTRRLLMLLNQFVGDRDRESFRFSRRQLREYSGWGDFQLRMHLERLVQLEYVLVHRGGRGQSFVYELVYDGAGKDGRPFLPGLIDVERLRHGYDQKFEPPGAGFEGPLSPQRGGVEPGSSIGESPAEAVAAAAGAQTAKSTAGTHI
jgi:DNA primase catalytic core